jgi:hypothetical protein
MAVVVDGRPASVHADFVVHQRPEILDLAGKGIEQAQGHNVKRTSIIGVEENEGQTSRTERGSVLQRQYFRRRGSAIQLRRGVDPDQARASWAPSTSRKARRDLRPRHLRHCSSTGSLLTECRVRPCHFGYELMGNLRKQIGKKSHRHHYWSGVGHRCHRRSWCKSPRYRLVTY